MIKEIKNDLRKLASPGRAKALQRFFKTGPGEYGEGDIFLGVSVPDSRRVAKKYSALPLREIEELLNSKIHEERLVALLLLVQEYGQGGEKEKESIFQFYLRNTKRVNNWDLVDLSADKIVGEHLLEKPRDLLYRLAKSPSLWERRISIISTFSFIRKGDCRDTLRIAELLLEDREDLIHKAVGWMLREVWKREPKAQEAFLKKHLKKMPRTALRYAIERFPEGKRRRYLSR